MVEILIGFAGGLLVGATGAGVGLLVTPLLILAGYPPASAIATGVGVLVAGKLLGSFAHHRLGHWPGGRAWVLLGGGTAGVALAWWITQSWQPIGAPSLNAWLRRLVAAALLAAAAGILLSNRNARVREVERSKTHPAVFFLVGVGSALPVTLTSLGSGSLLSPLLLAVTDWEVSQVAAASNFFGLAVGVLSVALHSRLGFLDLGLFARVLAGLLPGVAAGALLSRWVARRWFAYAMSGIALFLAARLFLS